MKNFIILISTVLLIILFLIVVKTHSKQTDYKTEESKKGDLQTIEYYLDSTYKVVTDTLLSIYKAKTGEKVSALPMPYFQIISMAMHPSGNFLAVLGEYSLMVYNLTGYYPYESDTTFRWSDELPELDLGDMDHIEFSADGKYLMAINYGDVEVKMYQWPGLKYLATAYMGFRRNSFSWKNQSGKLVFSYLDNNNIFRTEFPSDLSSDTLCFSEPVLIDSVAEIE